MIRSSDTLDRALVAADHGEDHNEPTREIRRKMHEAPVHSDSPREDAQRDLLVTEIGRIERESARVLADIRDLTSRLLHRDE